MCAGGGTACECCMCVQGGGTACECCMCVQGVGLHVSAACVNQTKLLCFGSNYTHVLCVGCSLFGPLRCTYFTCIMWFSPVHVVGG